MDAVVMIAFVELEFVEVVSGEAILVNVLLLERH